jgi:hypothetical protein
MAAADLGAGLAMARADLDRCCRMLETPSPQILDQCAEALAHAIGALANHPPCSSGISPKTLRADALQLRQSIRNARYLLETAAHYHLRWSRILGAMTAGYTARGSAAPFIAGSGRIMVQG